MVRLGEQVHQHHPLDPIPGRHQAGQIPRQGGRVAREIVVQVNGKLRSKILVPFGTPKEELEACALADERVKPYLEGKHIVKIITVPDKLVNIVVR